MGIKATAEEFGVEPALVIAILKSYIEPSNDMLLAGHRAETVYEAWQAMINVALKE